MQKVLFAVIMGLSLQPAMTAGDPLPVSTIAVPLVDPYEDPEDNFDQSHNISGVVCPEATWCVMVSDEKKGLHRIKIDRTDDSVSVGHDAAFDLDLPSKKFLDAHDLKKKDLKELDLEAVAASDTKVVFIGSHANKRNSGEVNPASHLVAVAKIDDLRSGSEVPAEWASLDKLFRREDMFPGALNRQLQCGGLNIEGATLFGDRLLIGLRSPTGTDAPEAYVISTPLKDLLSEKFSEAKLHRLPMDQPFIGIRSMETDGERVLLVTGDAGVNDLKDDAEKQCDVNENKEDPARPFQLRVWKPAAGDSLEQTVVVATFPKLDEPDFEGKQNRAKVEVIARDPGHAGAFFVFYDGSDKAFYLSDVQLP